MASIIEYLESKGGVGLLVVLDEQGRLFSEIEPEVAISSSTLSKRIDEALEIGFIEMQPVKRRERTRTQYILTGMGERLVRELSRESVVSSYWAMLEHQKQIRAGTASAIEWYKNNPSELLAFPEANEETLVVPNEETEEEEGDHSVEEPQVPTESSSEDETDDDAPSTDEPESDGEAGEEDTEDEGDNDESTDETRESDGVKQTALEFDENNKPI